MFSRTEQTGVVIWRGDSSQDAHDFLLAELQPFATQFCATQSAVTAAIRGNLGEFMSFWVGRLFDFAALQALKPANAFTPLSRISRPGVDLVWLNFGADPSDDFVVLQEVKTTGGASVGLADRLVDDYAKLFGVDPEFSLQIRLIAAKTEVEFTLQRPDLVSRVSALAGAAPRDCPLVQLVPTLVHDDAIDPITKLVAVRTSIAALGWAPSQIAPWAIALDVLGERIERLAMGRP